MGCDRRCLLDFSAGKNQLVSFDLSNNTDSIELKMDGSVFEEKPTFRMLGMMFSSGLLNDLYC